MRRLEGRRSLGRGSRFRASGGRERDSASPEARTIRGTAIAKRTKKERRTSKRDPPPGARAGRGGYALRAAHRVSAVEALVTGAVAHRDVPAGIAERRISGQLPEQLVLRPRRRPGRIRRIRPLRGL